MFLNKKIILLFFLISISIESQNNEINKDTIHSNELDEVVVTATRTKRQLSSLPMPVTLISKKQISQTGATRLKDILEEQTGIIVVSDFGTSEGVQLQGMDAAYTLILIDGLPIIGRSSGNIDLNRISVNTIKQIEIVKGPSSSLYGSEALGGVINIITENPKRNKTKGNLSYMTRFGAKEELDINTDFTHRKDNLTIIGSVNLNSSKGFDLSPGEGTVTAYPYKNTTGNLRVSYDFSDKISLITSGRFFSEKINDISGDALRDDYNVFGKITHNLTKNTHIDYSFYGTRFKTESVFNNELSVFDQTLYRPELKIQSKLGKHSFIAGIGANFDALERTFFSGKENYNSQYVFGQYDINLTNKLNLILGARFDNFNKFKSAFSPKISTSFTFNKWLTAKGSVGFGYKVPDFRQLFFNFRNTSSGYVVFGTQVLQELYGDLPEVEVLNSELKPESSIGYNLGFQLKPIKRLKIDVNFFRNDIKDLINTFVVSTSFSDLPGISVFSYENRNNVYTQGIEFDVKYRLNDNINFSIGYQFLDTGDKEEEAQINAGEIFIRREVSSPSEVLSISDYYGLANRSRHIANAKIFYTNYKHNFSANIRTLYKSKYALFDTNNSQGIIDVFDDFVASNILVNAAVKKTIYGFIDVQFGIDNLFNETGDDNTEVFQNNDNVLQLGRTLYGRIQFKI